MPSVLSDYYRTKEIYVKLPTQGKWYKNKLHLTDQGEIGVMPLSFKDEMLLQVPDSVYNGESLFEILKSILPDMEDPYEICMPDVDVILLASRIGGNDGKVPVDATCPKCLKLESYEIQILDILSKIQTVESIETELKNGLHIVFKPNTLKSVTSNQIKITENARVMRKIQGIEDPHELHAMFKNSLEQSSAANMVILADTIESITTPDNKRITDFAEITEWLSNSDSTTIRQLQKSNRDINKNGINNDFTFVCGNEECNHNFSTPVELNPTFFFINNS
jgi:hypothetical protein